MRTAGALLALAAVSIFLAVPAVAPPCAQVASNPCCAVGGAECAGMTSVGLCCQPAPTSRDEQGVLSQAPSERASRPQTWVVAPASLASADNGVLDVPAAGLGPRAREDLTSPRFSVLRL